MGWTGEENDSTLIIDVADGIECETRSRAPYYECEMTQDAIGIGFLIMLQVVKLKPGKVPAAANATSVRRSSHCCLLAHPCTPRASHPAEANGRRSTPTPGEQQTWDMI